LHDFAVVLADLGNLISGNEGDGILILGDGAIIQGNLIGTDVTGLIALLNDGFGIDLTGDNALIGGTTAQARNVISGNDFGGILGDGDNIIIQGNFVGTDATGNTPLPNDGTGIELSGAGGQIGGAVAGAGNLVAGNTFAGVDYSGDNGFIQGNIIGLDQAGTSAMPNDDIGLLIDGNNIQVGGTTALARNLISGNTGSGIDVVGDQIKIEGNFIGTDVTGTVALGNGDSGIVSVFNNGKVDIGGSAAGAGNVISGNVGFGIGSVLSDGSNSLIQGNKIGTDVTGTENLGNGDAGILLMACANFSIGGADAGSANTIAFNNNSGIVLSDDVIFLSGVESANILIQQNSLFDNLDFGILYSGNQTPVATPVLTNVTLGPNPVATGTLAGLPNTFYTIEFYKNPALNAAGNPEGKTFLGAALVNTDGNGNVAFNGNLNAAVMAGEVISATAVEAGANTSEFSNGLLAGGGGLPVELLTLEAQTTQKAVDLRWQTASETNNEGFYVERTLTPHLDRWSSIGFVAGAGTTTVAQTYRYRDTDVKAGQRYYYRLRQVDFDGSTNYSTVVVAQLEGTMAVGQIYPNPSSDQVQLPLEVAVGTSVRVHVYSSLGQLVFERQLTAEPNTTINWTVADWPAGAYQVMVWLEEERWQQRLIVGAADR
ncbi:MAG: T9SS type A sorting domain-containing protein, partial [Bacteroidota bacterium]